MRFAWVRLCCVAVAVMVLSIGGSAAAQKAADADNLNAEAIRLYQAGKYKEAIPFALQALALQEKALGPEHPDVGTALNNLAEVYRALGRYADAEPLYKRDLAISEKALGPEHPDVGTSLNNLAELYLALGRYAEAEPLYKRDLAISEKGLGPEHPNVATSLNNLAELYRVQGRYSQAESLYKRSLALREKALGQEHPDVGTSQYNLAELYRVQGRFSEGEPLYKSSLALYEKVLGPEHPYVASPLNGLASLYRLQGRYTEAEPLFKRSLAISEKALGLEHPYVGAALNNLAELYRTLGRHAEAEPLYKQNLVVLEKALGPEHPDVGTSLNNLAELFRTQGRLAEAETLHRRDLALREKALGPEHTDVGVSLNNLARLYEDQHRYAEAELLHKRSLAMSEKIMGPMHPDVALSLNNLAGLYWAQHRYSEAEPLFTRSLTVSETALGHEHPSVSVLHNNLAWLALARGDIATAAESWHRAATLLQRRAARDLGSNPGASLRSEARGSAQYFEGLVKATYRLAASGREEKVERAAEMFSTAQWVQVSEAAASLAQMAARSAKGSPELASLVRERQDLAVEWQGQDKLLVAARSELPARRNRESETALSERLLAIDTRLAAIDARLATEFPDFAALARPTASSVGEVQAALREDEALVLFLDTNARFEPLPEETFVWVVTKNQVRWVSSSMGTDALKREVAALRCGLDATAWYGDSATRCSELLSRALDKAPQQGEPLPFDTFRAHALYASLLGDVRDLIRGKHLLLVPSGALTTLPFQVLVTELPKSANLAETQWLILEHAITVLPSVASLASLRRTGKPSLASKPMIGFANPLLDGVQSHPQYGDWYKAQAERARSRSGCAASPKQVAAASRAVSRTISPVPQPGGIADLAHLKMQTPLPETADEVCEVARSIGALPSEMRIGERATETEVKLLSEAGDLAKYRIVHFATHGLLAGQLKGANEPGLILTPPTDVTPRDDGYLSGSEIAGLKLDADWVILSACNTAGGAGQGDAAEALSGLARVFFYAGTRALLVSHWEVDSDAAVKLVTGAIGALSKDKSIGRAEALRKAMLAMIANVSQPAGWPPASHPSVWAPFVVVGEGGVGR